MISSSIGEAVRYYMDGQYSFLALNKKIDWERGRSENLLLAESGVTLRKDHKYSLSRTIPQTEMGIAEPIINLCGGLWGLLFLLDQAANIWIYDFNNRQTTLLLKAGHGLFSDKALLAASQDSLFLVEPEPASVVALSATNGQILWTSREFYGGSPLALAISDSGDLLVVTSSVSSPSGSADEGLEDIKRQMMVLKVAPDGRARILFSSLPSWGQAGDCPQPGCIEAALGAENLYVLDTYGGQLWVLAPDGKLISDNRLNLSGPVVGLGVDSAGFIYTGHTRQQRQDTDNDPGLLKFSPPDPEPVGYVGYRGEADRLWLDRQDRLYLWDRSTLSLSILERQESIKLDSAGKPRGIFIFPVLDSTALEMEWHRITLHADIPDDTQIRLRYFASDSKELVIQDHLINMEEYLQDRDAAIAQRLDATEFLWSQELVNPRDALLHGARGRYLWLKIELAGSESRTPLLKSIRVYFPRQSLLRYLPAVYQEDEGSRDFLERFLSLFDTFLQGMEEQIDQVDRIFDPEAVPGSLLSRLAGWLGVNVDESWSEEQLRRLLIAAPDLYRKRGTREEMEAIITIYTGEKPFIVEYFQYKYLQETLELKQLMTQLYGQDPYGFTVLVKQERVPTAAQASALQRLIDEEKPAFTDARLVILQPWIYMDMHSYLGINTYLSELSLLRLDNKAAMPFSSVIVDTKRDNQLDTHSRMELDARLK